MRVIDRQIQKKLLLTLTDTDNGQRDGLLTRPPAPAQNAHQSPGQPR